MIKRTLFLICALSLALPGLAISATHNWGGLPNTNKTRFHGECCYNARAVHSLAQKKGGTGVGGAHRHSAMCNLAGVWKYYLTSYTNRQNAWIRFHITEKQKRGSHLIVYLIKRNQMPGGRRGVVFFDPTRRHLEIYDLLHTQYPYDMGYSTGTVASDCRSVVLTVHAGGSPTPARQSMTLIHH